MILGLCSHEPYFSLLREQVSIPIFDFFFVGKTTYLKINHSLFTATGKIYWKEKLKEDHYSWWDKIRFNSLIIVPGIFRFWICSPEDKVEFPLGFGTYHWWLGKFWTHFLFFICSKYFYFRSWWDFWLETIFFLLWGTRFSVGSNSAFDQSMEKALYNIKFNT